MQYTAMPLSYMAGVYFGIIICFILALFIIWGLFCWDSGDFDKIIKIFIMSFAFIVFSLTGYMSYDTYLDHKNLVNEQVVGKMVGNEAALERVSAGKGQTKLASVLYVFYEFPEGVVAFRRGSGIVYPDKAIFYRNPK